LSDDTPHQAGEKDCRGTAAKEEGLEDATMRPRVCVVWCSYGIIIGIGIGIGIGVGISLGVGVM
jgi:hypothetical protein